MTVFIDFTFIISYKLFILNKHYVTPTLIVELINNYVQHMYSYSKLIFTSLLLMKLDRFHLRNDKKI